jgi:hypothetical protein
MESIYYWWDAYWFGFQRYEAFFLSIIIALALIFWLVVAALRRKGLVNTLVTFAIIYACIPFATVIEEAHFRGACAQYAGCYVYDTSALKSTDWSQYMGQEESIPEKHRYPFKDLGLVMDYYRFEKDYSLENTKYTVGKVPGTKRQLIRKTDSDLIAESVNFSARTHVFLSQRGRSCNDTPSFSRKDFPNHVYEFLSPYIEPAENIINQGSNATSWLDALTRAAA